MLFDAQCGERLRQERDLLGLSQQALADAAGVQRAMLSRYERGIAEPGASVLMKLAQQGIDVDYVLFGALAHRDGKPARAEPGWGQRLQQERLRLGLKLDAVAEIAGITPTVQEALEAEKRRPGSEYLEALAMHDVDVSYVLTAHRMLMQSKRAMRVTEEQGRYDASGTSLVRELTPEEAALLDNYNAADEKGRAAARSVLDALAEPKKRANG